MCTCFSINSNNPANNLLGNFTNTSQNSLMLNNVIPNNILPNNSAQNFFTNSSMDACSKYLKKPVHEAFFDKSERNARTIKRHLQNYPT